MLMFVIGGALTACGSDGASVSVVRDSLDRTTATAATAPRATQAPNTAATAVTTVAPATTAPRSAPTTTGGGPSTIRWEALGPEDCITTIPDGDFEFIEVIGCDQPHIAEFVGRVLNPKDLETKCVNLFKSYTGKTLEALDATVVWFEPAPGSSSFISVCLGSPADGSPTVGSWKKA